MWINGASRTGTAEHKRWRTQVLERDGYRCRACGHQGSKAAGDMRADHIVNVAAGGTTTLDNGQALCKPCHDRKTAREAAAARKSRTRPAERHPGIL